MTAESSGLADQEVESGERRAESVDGQAESVDGRAESALLPDGSGDLEPDGGRPVLDDALANFDWAIAVASGVGSAILGYIVFALVFVLGPASFGTISSTTEQLRQLGLLFYNAHLVDLVTEADPGAALLGGQRLNLITESAGTSAIPIVVYLLIPVVVLLLVGLVVARWLGATEWVQGAFTGAGFAIGYVVVLLAGTPLVTRSTPSASLGPDLLQVVAFGLAYPVLLATVGATVAIGIASWSNSGQ